MDTYGLVVSHLLYADETLLVADSTMKNLWKIKVILRGFKEALSIIFKSSLIETNLDSTFLSDAEDFHHYGINSLPLNYLGFLVWDTPWFDTTWDPLVILLEKRIKSWKKRYVNLGGRVVLLNFVLNNIPYSSCIF